MMKSLTQLVDEKTAKMGETTTHQQMPAAEEETQPRVGSAIRRRGGQLMALDAGRGVAEGASDRRRAWRWKRQSKCARDIRDAAE